ncbi:hypothetical protein ACVMIL_011109 [Bradyrhizobium barranii subsp. barranii]
MGEAGELAGLDRHHGIGAGDRDTVDIDSIAGGPGRIDVGRREADRARRLVEQHDTAVGVERRVAVGAQRHRDADLLRHLRDDVVALVEIVGDVVTGDRPLHDRGVDLIELGQELIDIPDRSRHVGVRSLAHRLHGLGGLVERGRHVLGGRDRRLRQRGVVRSVGILLERLLQLVELGSRRLPKFGIVHSRGRYLLKTVQDRILLGGPGRRDQDVIIETRAGGALDRRHIDAGPGEIVQHGDLARIAGGGGTGYVARDRRRLDARRHERRTSGVESGGKGHDLLLPGMSA